MRRIASSQEVAPIVNDIQDIISEEYAKASKNFMDLNLKTELLEVDAILQSLESWGGYTSSSAKEQSLKNAYLKIMQIRTALLGKDSEIQYRLYIRGDAENINDVKIMVINEEQLMTVVGRDRNALRLKHNLDSVIAEQNADNTRQAIFNQHFSNISKGLEHPSRSPKNYVVTKSVIDQYGGVTSPKVSNLVYQTDTTKGKSAYTLKIFNRGWIYQAFDMTTEQLMQEEIDFNAYTTYALFHRKYFTENLDYDNLVGFKGGDVGLMQIKSNMASLMSKVTLIKYLKIIKEILSGGSFVNKEELKEYIKANFTNTDIITDSLLNEIDINVDKIWNETKLNKEINLTI